MTVTRGADPAHIDTAYIETLTDEELAVLAPPDPLAVQPFLDELPEDQRDTARRVAYRGLLARGIIDPPAGTAMQTAVAAARSAGDGAAGVAVDVMVRRDVQSLVELRRGAGLVVALARTTSVALDYWYAYLVDDLALVEEVSPDGIHRFSLVGEDRLLGLVIAAAVHPLAADSAGNRVPMPTGTDVDIDAGSPPPEILQVLGQALLRTDLVVRHRAESTPTTSSFFTGPSGSWLVRRHEPEPTYAQPVSVPDIREHVGRTVGEAQREVVLHDR
jgi:hypothetical protein